MALGSFSGRVARLEHLGTALSQLLKCMVPVGEACAVTATGHAMMHQGSDASLKTST